VNITANRPAINHKDHRNRITMNATEQKELIAQLWQHQVGSYITSESKDH